MPVFFGGVTFWSLILLLAGLGFLVAELFHPGFGAFGVLGIAALILDILISSRTLAQGLLFTALLAVLGLILFLAAARLMSRGKMPKPLVLREENGENEGFNSTRQESELAGQTGTAETPLHPAGIARIGGKRVDVVTRGEFIEQGTPLRVLMTEGGRIVVAPDSERSN